MQWKPFIDNDGAKTTNYKSLNDVDNTLKCTELENKFTNDNSNDEVIGPPLPPQMKENEKKDNDDYEIENEEDEEGDEDEGEEVFIVWFQKQLWDVLFNVEFLLVCLFDFGSHCWSQFPLATKLD